MAERLERDGISDAAAAAREILLLIEGAMVMILIHGDRSYASAAASAAQRLLRSRYHTGGDGSKVGSLKPMSWEAPCFSAQFHPAAQDSWRALEI